MIAIINNDLLPVWADRQIDSIGRHEIKELVHRKAETAPAAACRLLVMIGTIFNYAVDEEYLTSNPARRIQAPAPLVIRDRVLDAPEVARYWKAAADTGPVFCPFFRVLLLTGQRRTEVAELPWSEIDLDGALWTLPRERTKNAKTHTVPLSAPAVAILRQIERNGPYVFSKIGRGPITGFSAPLAILRAAVGGEDWRLHDVRRTVAYGMGGLNIHNETIGKVLNHTDNSVTARVYNTNPADDAKRAALDTWAEHVIGLLS